MLLSADEPSLLRCAHALRAGELVAFPTETVYGLGARADHPQAVARIYEMKGRPAQNPSIVHVDCADSAFALTAGASAGARALARAFWPGPLTLVMRVRPGALAPLVTAHGATVALRVPAHPVARRLLELAGLPIAAPSANRSSSISPTTAQHVQKSLGSSFLILDAGATGFGIESTIVNVTEEPFVVLRRGSIDMGALLRVAPAIDGADAVVPHGTRADAPGMSAKHYAPRAPLHLVEPGELLSWPAPERSGYLVLEESAVPAGAAHVERLPAVADAFARELYAALHRLDDAACPVIIVERPPADDAWLAILDRLRRAATARSSA